MGGVRLRIYILDFGLPLYANQALCTSNNKQLVPSREHIEHTIVVHTLYKHSFTEHTIVKSLSDGEIKNHPAMKVAAVASSMYSFTPARALSIRLYYGPHGIHTRVFNNVLLMVSVLEVMSCQSATMGTVGRPTSTHHNGNGLTLS